MDDPERPPLQHRGRLSAPGAQALECDAEGAHAGAPRRARKRPGRRRRVSRRQRDPCRSRGARGHPLGRCHQLAATADAVRDRRSGRTGAPRHCVPASARRASARTCRTICRSVSSTSATATARSSVICVSTRSRWRWRGPISSAPASRSRCRARSRASSRPIRRFGNRTSNCCTRLVPPESQPWFPGIRPRPRDAFMCRPVILHPESRGELRLRSADPRDPRRDPPELPGRAEGLGHHAQGHRDDARPRRAEVARPLPP